MIAHGRRASGYVKDMLAVVALLPIAIMLAACLLERFEARATEVRPPTRVRRPAPGAPHRPVAPALALVPDAAHAPGTAADLLDADTRELPRAS